MPFSIRIALSDMIPKHLSLCFLGLNRNSERIPRPTSAGLEQSRNPVFGTSWLGHPVKSFEEGPQNDI
jgi:hypothetical protein